MSGGAVRVMLLGVPRLFRQGLRSVLECEADVTVVAEGDTVQEAQTVLTNDGADVCVVNVDQEGSAELLDAALEMVQTGKVTVIVLAGRLGLLGLSEALNRGVSGVVLTDQTPDILRKAVTRVHAGEVWLNRDMTAGVLRQLTPARRNPRGSDRVPQEPMLTKREREIVALVGRGWRNGEIAQSLYISDVTVRNHLTSIFRKLSLSSRVALAAYAYRHGLAVLPVRAGPPLKTPLAGSTPSDVSKQKTRR